MSAAKSYPATDEVKPAGSAAASLAITGDWKAELDTQVGKQKYVYRLKADGAKLTGKAIGDIAGQKQETEIQSGKIDGTQISFVEVLKFQGQDVSIAYSGNITGDEIKFTRTVADAVTGELVARRAK